MRFSDKHVLITGGATGIGYATAKRFAAEGAKVTMVGRREGVGKRAEQMLQEEGCQVRFIQGDVSIEADVERFMDEAIRAFGPLDILVNNAAISNSIGFLNENTSQWKQVFDVIVNGTYFCSRGAAKRMIASGIEGAIVNVSSINGYRALEASSHYNAAKGAMDQLTRCTAVELISQGIRVNGVNPGFIDTDMSIVDGENELETEWFKSIYVERKKIPQQRAGRPEEVAGVIAFLASADASYLCGASIPVDGGLSITF